MCSNYQAVTEIARLAEYFGVVADNPPLAQMQAEVYPVRLGTFIRLSAEGRKLADTGQFGLLPHFAREVSYGRRTYNSRSETVATLPSFRTAWKREQRCIIPAERIYEPCYESGKAVRWAIELPDGLPMGIAGIWSEHPHFLAEDGSPLLSFAMLTVNADGHPVFQRMHRPEDEKRMVVILHADQYDPWLTCSVADAPTFFRQFLGDLHVCAAPAPPRAKKPKQPGPPPVL
ncbi:SOS response-associated peptidase [Panacagrimonas sp.]|uniref:SOS response-associated peptidase n=1 Tax=Panacagrimonas sp. TaxID=2480088 RepID=UPI003B51B379